MTARTTTRSAVLLGRALGPQEVARLSHVGATEFFSLSE
jgi:hypothetical protein